MRQPATCLTSIETPPLATNHTLSKRTKIILEINGGAQRKKTLHLLRILLQSAVKLADLLLGLDVPAYIVDKPGTAFIVV